MGHQVLQQVGALEVLGGADTVQLEVQLVVLVAVAGTPAAADDLDAGLLVGLAADRQRGADLATIGGSSPFR